MTITVRHNASRDATVTHAPGLLGRILGHTQHTRVAVGDTGGRWYWCVGGSQIFCTKTLCALWASQTLWELRV